MQIAAKGRDGGTCDQFIDAIGSDGLPAAATV